MPDKTIETIGGDQVIEVITDNRWVVQTKK